MSNVYGQNASPVKIITRIKSTLSLCDICRNKSASWLLFGANFLGANFASVLACYSNCILWKGQRVRHLVVGDVGWVCLDHSQSFSISCLRNSHSQAGSARCASAQ